MTVAATALVSDPLTSAFHLEPGMGSGLCWLEGSDVVQNHPGLLPRWGALAQTAESISLHPEFVLREASTLIYVHEGGAAAGEASALRLAALAPKNRRARLPGLPFGLTLHGRRLVGNQLLGEGPDDFVQALAERLRRAGLASDFVLFEDIEVSSPLWRAVEREATRGFVTVYYPEPCQPHWWLRFPATGQEYWKRFTSKTRYNLRRAAEKLPHTMVCVREPGDVAGFLEKAQTVSERSWQGKRLGLRIRNTPAERSYFEFLARHGALRSYLLEQDGRPLAFEVATQWNGVCMLEETAYDMAFAERSPGTVLFYRVLHDLFDRDTPRLLDFGFGDGEYKRVFGTHQTQSGPVLLVRRGLRPQAAILLERARRAVGRGLRAASARLRVLSALRRLYRQ